MKIRPVGAYSSMRTDGRTDITKLIVALFKFANAPKNQMELFSSSFTKVCPVFTLTVYELAALSGRVPCSFTYDHLERAVRVVGHEAITEQ